MSSYGSSDITCIRELSAYRSNLNATHIAIFQLPTANIHTSLGDMLHTTAIRVSAPLGGAWKSQALNGNAGPSIPASTRILRARPLPSHSHTAIRSHMVPSTDSHQSGPAGGHDGLSPLSAARQRSTPLFKRSERRYSSIPPRTEPNSSPSTTSSTPPDHSKAPRGLTARYAPRLHALSLRTGVPLSTLAAAFLVLHELTAILPLGALYFILQALGAGAGLVLWLESVAGQTGQADGEGSAVDSLEDGVAGSQTRAASRIGREEGQGVGAMVAAKVREWMREGGERVEKVGKRYGILGFDKVVKQPNTVKEDYKHVRDDGAAEPNGLAGTDTEQAVQHAVAGSGAADKVASAITAYVLVKVRWPFPDHCGIPGMTDPFHDTRRVTRAEQLTNRLFCLCGSEHRSLSPLHSQEWSYCRIVALWHVGRLDDGHNRSDAWPATQRS